MTFADAMQYLGAALGLSGAVLVSQRHARLRRWGFMTWILSNACLVWWTVSTGTWGLMAMYTIYSLTSFMGWWNHRPGRLAS
jgi:hypothetical protein